MDEPREFFRDNVIRLPVGPAADRGPESDPQRTAPQPEKDRNTEIFLRISFGNHLRLHAMADNKSRMLIHVNGVILSGLAAYCSTAAELEIPVATITALLCTSALSMLAALLAAFPPRVGGGPGDADSASDSIALSTLGAIRGRGAVSMNGVLAATQDDASLQLGLLASLRRLGDMLEVKHRRLRAAYGILAIGILVGVAPLAAAIAR